MDQLNSLIVNLNTVIDQMETLLHKELELDDSKLGLDMESMTRLLKSTDNVHVTHNAIRYFEKYRDFLIKSYAETP